MYQKERDGKAVVVDSAIPGQNDGLDLLKQGIQDFLKSPPPDQSNADHKSTSEDVGVNSGHREETRKNQEILKDTLFATCLNNNNQKEDMALNSSTRSSQLQKDKDNLLQNSHEGRIKKLQQTQAILIQHLKAARKLMKRRIEQEDELKRKLESVPLFKLDKDGEKRLDHRCLRFIQTGLEEMSKDLDLITLTIYKKWVKCVRKHETAPFVLSAQTDPTEV